MLATVLSFFLDQAVACAQTQAELDEALVTDQAQLCTRRASEHDFVGGPARGLMPHKHKQAHESPCTGPPGYVHGTLYKSITGKRYGPTRQVSRPANVILGTFVTRRLQYGSMK